MLKSAQHKDNSNLSISWSDWTENKNTSRY